MYATFAVSETLNHGKKPAGTEEDDSEDEDELDEEHEREEAEEHGWVETIETLVDPLVEPIRPLKLLLPRKENGVWHWRLFIVTLSMLSTSCGVSHARLISGQTCSAR